MATPKPGEIRCPTCHRSTPPAAFCTQCGSVIPPDARARPRGMDRDELQDRIRARRSGGDPYRRGSEADEGTGVYEKFEPDDSDSLVRAASRADEPRQDLLDESAAPPAPPVPPVPPADLTHDDDDWVAPPPAAPAAAAAIAATAATAAEPPPGEAPVAALHDEPYDDQYADQYADAYPDQYEAWDEPRERSGTGPLAIVGFLGLGVLALLAGAVLASLWGSGGVGQGDPTPTAAVSVAPSIAATPEVTASPIASAEPSGSATASGGPIVFPDGFVAEAQPCLPGSSGGNGCDSNGVSNTGAVDIWVGFENGNANDVIGATVEAPDGSTTDGSIDLSRIGCGRECNGYTWFSFSNLDPGTYEVRITRNGEPAGSTMFEVT
ncbi:MAG TPA: hypothetical protein VI277_09495 [Candidatus Limnocylindria bacterium]